MLTLVDIPTSHTSAVEAASLIADYVAFDEQRTSRRQYSKAFGGMAIVVLFGALFNYVPRGEAMIVDGLLLLPPLGLSVVELFRWHRLNGRLNELRIQTQAVKKS